MPATAMAQTDTFSNANSTTGRFVLMDPLSGPTGSPKAGATSLFGGAGTLGLIDTTYPTYSGGLATGIGMGPGNANNSPTLTQGEATIPSADLAPNTITALPPLGSRDFIDDLLIGVRAAWIPSGATGNPAKPTNFDSEMVYLGGGRSAATGISNPYTAGTNVYGFGQGGSRDGGAGPAFTGFPSKIVTAAAGVAAGAVVEAGFTNRTGGAMLTGQNTFGSSVAAGAAVA